MSQAFSCRPSEAYREWLACPAGLLETMLEYRAYRSAYHTFAANPKATGDLVDLVKVITFELVQEEFLARTNGE